MARATKRTRRSQDEVLVYKEIEYLVKSARKRIPGLLHLTIDIRDNGKTRFRFKVQRGVIEDSGEI